MEEHARPGPSPPPPLQLRPDDLLVEILLRLPPEPIHLFRASLVSKHWHRLVHDARFLRRFREFHGGTPPVLGFFSNQMKYLHFFPTSAGLAVPADTMVTRGDWWALDCRHGRALLENFRSEMLLVWDLMTDDECYLFLPTIYQRESCNGTVLCAAGHADHGDCHSCPFLVVYVFSPRNHAICACVWSSETRVWSEITSIVIPSLSVIDLKQSALVGNTLYWLLGNCSIVEYDLDNHRLGLTEEMPEATYTYVGIVIMPTEDGLLGLAGVEGLNVHLWSLMGSIDGLVKWAHQRVIDLENFLAPEVVAASCNVCAAAIGFAEDAGVIFIYVHPSIYIIHLRSMRIEELSQKGLYDSVIPYTSFYAPGITIGAGDDQAEMLNNN